MQQTSCFFHAATEFKDVAVFGIEDEADAVVEGDLYVCIQTVDRDGHDDVEAAVANGAVAVVAEREVEGVPEGVPLIITDDTEDLAARLAVAFYGECSHCATSKQHVVACAWLALRSPCPPQAEALQADVCAANAHRTENCGSA